MRIRSNTVFAILEVTGGLICLAAAGRSDLGAQFWSLALQCSVGCGIFGLGALGELWQARLRRQRRELRRRARLLAMDPFWQEEEQQLPWAA